MEDRGHDFESAVALAVAIDENNVVYCLKSNDNNSDNNRSY